MEYNEKALKREQNKNIDTNIIPEKADNYNFLPKIVRDMLKCCNKMFFDLNDTVKLNVLLVKIAQMLNSKRITINESGNIVIPNYYAILFIGSGYGKDRLVKVLNNYFFKDFRVWFNEQAENFYNKQLEEIEKQANMIYSGTSQAEERKKQSYINEEKKKIRKLVLEISNGTQEGLCADAKAFKNAQFGSLFLIISELGNFIDVKTNERVQFMNCVYEAYDGRIINKCIKGEQREPDVEDMPFVALLYSDYTRILTDLKNYVFLLLATGLNRRSVISFQADTKLKNITLSDEEEKAFYTEAREIGVKLFSIFFNLEKNATFDLMPEAKEQLREYKQKLINLYNNENDDNLRKEYKSRELKALKLSGLYACLNHNNRYVIEPEDMQQAIDTIEFMSKDFPKFINYKVVRKDLFDIVFNFFETNLGKSFTKSELTTNRFKEMGIPREKLKKEFNSIIETMKDIAEDKGYCFIEQKVNKNCGTAYTLMEISSTDSGLKQLIQ